MLNKPSIYDEFTYKGSWWLPGFEDRKVSGILKYSNTGIVLELFGSFNGINFVDRAQEKDTYQIVLGDCYEGKVTLIDCIVTNQQAKHFLEEDRQQCLTSILIQTVIMGMHSVSKETIKFSKLQVHFSNLEVWLRYSPFKSTSEPIGIVLKDIETFEAYLEEMELKISSTYTIGNRSEMYEHEGLEYKPFIVFESTTPQNLKWFNEVIWKFRNFLCVLTDSNIFVESIASPRVGLSIEVNIYPYPLPNYRDIKLQRFNSFMVGIQEIQVNIETILKKWYTTNINSSILMFVNTISRDNLLLEDKFLSYSKAIESAHRENTSVPSKFIDDFKYKELVDKMLLAVKDDIDSDLKNKLQSTLKYANEFGFQRRIKEVLKNIPEELQPFILLGLSISKFADRIRINRDYYTHFGDYSDFLFEPRQLIYTNKSLKLIVLWMIFDEIGISNEVLIRALEEDYFWLSTLKKGKELFK